MTRLDRAREWIESCLTEQQISKLQEASRDNQHWFEHIDYILKRTVGAGSEKSIEVEDTIIDNAIKELYIQEF